MPHYDRYKFFTPPDYFAQDLVNIMRIPSTDRIHIHAMLAYPDTQVSHRNLLIILAGVYRAEG